MGKFSKNNPHLLLLAIVTAILLISLVPAQRSETLPVIQAVRAETNLTPDNTMEPAEVVYTIKSGDSLAKVAVLYKVNLSDLKAWNKSVINKTLRPGDKLVIRKVEYPAVEGLASWYGPGFHGQNMANGEVYDMNSIVVAHRSLPLGRFVRVTNMENGRSLIAPVLDRGPYVKNSHGEYTREIDLSYAVAMELGTVRKGVVKAKVEPLPEPWPIN